jgi:hypothetical protein
MNKLLMIEYLLKYAGWQIESKFNPKKMPTKNKMPKIYSWMLLFLFTYYFVGGTGLNSGPHAY